MPLSFSQRNSGPHAQPLEHQVSLDQVPSSMLTARIRSPPWISVISRPRCTRTPSARCLRGRNVGHQRQGGALHQLVLQLDDINYAAQCTCRSRHFKADVATTGNDQARARGERSLSASASSMLRR